MVGSGGFLVFLESLPVWNEAVMYKPESTQAMYAGVDTRVDGQGRANRPGQVPIDGDEGGVQ